MFTVYSHPREIDPLYVRPGDQLALSEGYAFDIMWWTVADPPTIDRETITFELTRQGVTRQIRWPLGYSATVREVIEIEPWDMTDKDEYYA